MTKIELTKEIIKEKFIRPDNNLNTRAFHLYTIDGISKINKHQITKVWLNLTEIPVCKECKKETQYISYKEGYRNFCSSKCAANSEETRNKTSKTNIAKYGTPNVFQSEVFKENNKKRYDKIFLEKNLKIPSKVLRDFNIYKREVYRITRRQKIDELTHYGEKCYNLDHKYSIWYGFFNNITPIYIGNINNLEFLTEFENKSKSIECSIFISDLIIK